MANVLFIFLIYSTAMLTLPLLTFFAVKNILEKEFSIIGFANTAWSVICAVVVVNIIIMVYAWNAYKQEVEEESNGSGQMPIMKEVPPLTKSDLELKKQD